MKFRLGGAKKIETFQVQSSEDIVDALKRSAYSLGGKAEGEFVYFVDGSMVVFSALTQNPSSVNAWEWIIATIVEAEHLDLALCGYYDLLTHRGYNRLRPGQHEVNEVRIAVHPGTFFYAGWNPSTLPDHLLAKFHELIQE